MNRSVAIFVAWLFCAVIQASPAESKHWAFILPAHAALPVVQQKDWPRNGIDFFILARLEQEQIHPSAEAGQITLLRRLSLDLIGLPPTLAEVDAFLSDKAAGAYERVVDRLLASPHYGERWGRHWLDVARYADSNGYSIDAPRSIWKYRDWVIEALNNNMPFDEFVIEQLAGDLLPNPTLDQQIATGFHRQTQINQEGGIDPEQFRVESVIDRVNTTGTAFLGLTIGCAQCHNHKFDPISQREYYQLMAFFNNTIPDGHGESAPGGALELPNATEPLDDIEKEIAETEAELDRYLNTKGSELAQRIEPTLSEAQLKKFKPPIQAALKIPFASRTLKQKREVYAALGPNDADFKQRNSKLVKLEKRQPRPVTTLVMVEQKKPRQSTIFIKGDFTRPGDLVNADVPKILPPLKKTRGSNDPATRLDLARWLVDPANPLTARVAVNRIWQRYFGRGLVETENDFGTQGAPPSHPELLDWLATTFIESGWNVKALHRLIVTSASYRQSSRTRPELEVRDPNNRLLARQSRFRLDSEIVRDVSLMASGLLSEKMEGPSVFPPQPDGVMNLGQLRRPWKVSAGSDRYRRGLYTFFWRATPHPALMVFDSPDAFSACTRRIRSNTPLQALTLLNDAAFYECAEALARRVTAEKSNDAERIDLAFRLCLSRAPAADERDRLLTLLKDELNRTDGSSKTKEFDSWTTVARVVLNLDETITRE